jgi:hypothetical protein
MQKYKKCFCKQLFVNKYLFGLNVLQPRRKRGRGGKFKILQRS